MVFFRYSLLFLFSFASISLGLTQNPTGSWQSKVHDRVFAELDQHGKAEIIIEFKDQADLSASAWLTGKTKKSNFVFNHLEHQANLSQANVRNWMTAQGIRYREFRIVNAIYAECNAQQLEHLAKQEEIRLIQFNIKMSHHQPIRANDDHERSPETVEWGIAKINADDVWDLGYDGSGVVVGGQDTGYDWDHEALIEKYRGWNGSSVDHNFNWHDAIHEIDSGNTGTNPCGLDSSEPCDDHYHGTHTMGTMVGSNGGIEIGVAPGAQWIGCRNMERGDGTPATYLECFDWFLAPTDINDENPDPSKSPHVINNSWSCPPSEGCDGSYDFSFMATAIQNLESAGVVVVVSAGNEGPDCYTVENPPAFYVESFSVGATNSSDDIANFSSRGPASGYGSGELKPNVSAPGVSVYSSEPDDDYGTHSGTSMAGPHVAGAVALLISADPSLAGDVSTIKSLLENTAVPLTSTQSCGGISGDDIPNNTFGHGRIDVLAAVNFALGNTPLDIVSFDGNVTNKYVELHWEVKNIENESHFELEKSHDQSSWFNIGHIGIDNSTTYQFNDYNPFNGTNYYRLKIMDDNGKYRYSSIVVIHHSLPILSDLYPNPVSKNKLYFISDITSDHSWQFIITNMDGKMIKNVKAYPVMQQESIEIDLQGIPAGIYILSVLNDQGAFIDRTRFVKQ